MTRRQSLEALPTPFSFAFAGRLQNHAGLMNHKIQTAIAVLISFLVLAGRGGMGCVGAEATNAGSILSVYEEPKLLTGAVYSSEPGSKKLLYKFTRTSTRSGAMVKVQRDFTYPDGKPAAREVITYEGNALVSFELAELQIGASGSAKIRRDADKPTKNGIDFGYTKEPGGKPKQCSEGLAENTLNSDMIATFLASHWDTLVRGEKVKSRYIVVPRMETVGFTFVKEPETPGPDRKVVIIKMEATSPILAALVDPLFFTLEKAPPHRVLQYAGRTTPKIPVGGKWKDLDALTIFYWDSAR